MSVEPERQYGSWEEIRDELLSTPEQKAAFEQYARRLVRKERIYNLLVAPLRPFFRLPLVGDVIEVFWTSTLWFGVDTGIADLRDTFIKHIYYKPSEARRGELERDYAELRKAPDWEQEGQDCGC